MPFPSQITTGTGQPAQPESRRESPQQDQAAAPEPRKGNPSDHPAYHGKRPLWTEVLSVKNIPPTGAAAIHADEAGMQQKETNVTAQSEPPSHIRCLGERYQAIYISLWKQLPGVPAHWSKKALSDKERRDARNNIGIRQQLDKRSREILKSHPDDEPLSQSLAQSEASLKTLWAAVQTNRAIFGVPPA